MKTFEKITVVDECYHHCPFFGNAGNEMECLHPHLLLKGNVWDRMIITQQNSRGRVPDECPLRAGAVKMVEQIELTVRYATTTTTTTKAPKTDGLPDGFKFSPSGRVVLENNMD
jgi:hypothetical protein